MRYKFKFIFVIVGSLVIFSSASGQTRPRIAVLPFDFSTITKRWWPGGWNIGRGISDQLVNELVNAGAFSVVERSKLAAVMKEQSFGESGLVDPASAAKLGKVLGVPAIAIGSVTEFTVEDLRIGGLGVGLKRSEAKVGLNVQIVHTSTAEILAAAEGAGKSSRTGISAFGAMSFGSKEFESSILGEATKQAVSEVARQLSTRAPQIGSIAAPRLQIRTVVADVAKEEVIIDGGIGIGIQKGQRLYVGRLAREVKSPTTGQVIRRIVDILAEVEVTEVSQTASTAKIVSRSADINAGDLVSDEKSF